MTKNFRYKNCVVCGSKFKPKSGIQKYCKACSDRMKSEAKHKYYMAHRKDNKPTVKPPKETKNVKALYDEDISDIIKTINRNNTIWCAISVIAMIIAIIAIVL